MMRYLSVVFLLFSLCSNTSSQSRFKVEQNDSLYIINDSPEQIVKLLRFHTFYPFCYQDVVISLLYSLKDRPYGSGGGRCKPYQTLVNVCSFDCVTLVENLLAMAFTLKDMANTLYMTDEEIFQTYLNYLNQMRYYSAEPDSQWENRIFYFTEQMNQLIKRGWVVDISNAGGIPFLKPIYYISRNKRKYIGIRDWKRIRQIERRLSNSTRYYFPLEQLHCYEAIAQNGDIVALTTTVEGLEVSHCGIITVRDGELYFSHASLTKRKVVVEEHFRSYLKKRDTITGIIVYRVTF